MKQKAETAPSQTPYHSIGPRLSIRAEYSSDKAKELPPQQTTPAITIESPRTQHNNTPNSFSLFPSDPSIITIPQKKLETPRSRAITAENTRNTHHRSLNRGALLGILLVEYSVDEVDGVLDTDRDSV